MYIYEYLHTSYIPLHLIRQTNYAILSTLSENDVPVYSRQIVYAILLTWSN